MTAIGNTHVDARKIPRVIFDESKFFKASGPRASKCCPHDECCKSESTLK
jgi:hypothetical protein